VDALILEVERLVKEGLSLIPVGGDDGKKPLVKFGYSRPLSERSFFSVF
jgi:hypothetical protein